MAEVAGLTVGFVGLAGLFSSAVDCFEYVRIARSFDQDFATSQLKLDAASFRLSRWGEAIRVQEQGTASLPREQFMRAERILRHLCNLFVQAQEKAEIFSNSNNIATYDVNLDMSPVQQFVHRGIIKKTRQRIERQRVSLVQRTKWALYKKKELDNLIDDITSMVSQLELIAPPGQASEVTLQRVAELEITELQEAARIEQHEGGFTELEVAESLYDAASGQDPCLEDLVKKLIEELKPKADTETTYNITQRVEGGVKDNTGIFAVYNSGSLTQTFYGAHANDKS